jgi:hypothetical protein
MARSKTLINKRNSFIRERFEDLRNLKEHGVRKHSSEWCIHEIAHQVWLEPTTVSNIVYSTE